MEQIIGYITQALDMIVNAIDWVYVFFFMITAYAATRILGDSNVAKKVNLKISKRWIVLIVAAVLAIVFGVVYYFNGGFTWFKPDILPYGFAIFLSFLIAMFLNEYVGFEYILDKIFKVELNTKDYKKAMKPKKETGK